MNILLCVTGSVAASVANKLFKELSNLGEVKVVATKSALEFMPPMEKVVITDVDEWKVWHEKKQVLHIDLKNWTDVIVLAPLSANTMAKICNGICDNLITSILRAYPVTKKVIFCPAMNTDMWNHPITKSQIKLLSQLYWACMLSPVEKTLACGDTGIGAMAEARDIAEATSEFYYFREV